MFLSSHLMLIPPATKPMDLAKNRREYSVYYIPESSDMKGISGPRPVITLAIPTSETQ
jgi:hypothetical protein